MASLVERLKRKTLDQTSFDGVRAGAFHMMLVNPDGPEAADHITALERAEKEALEWATEQHKKADEYADRITALEAMCDTLAGALEEADYYLCHEGYTVSAPVVKRLSEALTQYRAMKENNDG